MTQLIVTMRRELARRFAKNRALLDVDALLKPVRSAHLIGRPGYSMRVSVDEADVAALRTALGRDYIIQPDFMMRVLTQATVHKRAARRTASPASLASRAAERQPR